jgi:ABC-type dipeptide/oligopeptide/nickel transport system permease component
MRLTLYLARRTFASVIAVLGVLCLVFFVAHVLPGNPVLARATNANQATIRRVEQQLGLTRPLGAQFVSYLRGLAHGNLGTSYLTGRPVATDISQRAAASIELALCATVVAVAVSVPLGVGAALRRGGWLDRFARGVAALSVSMPSFWVGLLLIYFFYFRLSLAAAPLGRLGTAVRPPPTVTGLYTVDALVRGQLATFANAAWHLVLPAVTLALVVSAPLIRVTRSSMIEALDQPYIIFARALGLPKGKVVLHDGLRSSLLSVLTVIGLIFGYLVSGSVLVEQVFAWPGIGQYAFNALASNDIPSIEGFVLVVAVVYVGVNWAVDILYGFIDPRVRVA